MKKLDESLVLWLKKHADTLTEEEKRNIDEAFNDDRVNEKKKVLKNLDKMIQHAVSLMQPSEMMDADDETLDQMAIDSPEKFNTDYKYFNELYRIMYEHTVSLSQYKKDQRGSDSNPRNRFSRSDVDLPSPQSYRTNDPDNY